MKDGAIDKAELLDALFHAIPAAIVAVDGEGAVVEWNHAAEEYTGISRDEAMRATIWDVQARVAPATIPDEQARHRSRERFLSLLAMCSETSNPWVEEFEGEILSTSGNFHHIRSEVFPVWLHRNLFLIGVLSTAAHLTVPHISTEYVYESAHR